MMTFTSALEGYKRKMHKKVGVPVSNSMVLSLECIEPSETHQEYFGASQHQVSQEFLHSSEMMCLVLCFITVVHF